MKLSRAYLQIAFLLLLISACGDGGKSRIEQIKEQSKVEPADPYENWQQFHGVGPVKEFTLAAEVDQQLATTGRRYLKPSAPLVTKQTRSLSVLHQKIFSQEEIQPG